MRILKKPWQFREVYDRGKKVDGRFAVVFYYEGADAVGGTPTFGVVTSRKVGGAVQRNRARRRLRAAIRSLEPFPRDKTGWVVCVARAEVVTAPYNEFMGEFRRLMRRLGLIE